ncbi:hypothetical protein M413DRAFT_14281 [Hebeloma cylindrosporum]|uniref:Uncharacterized protein n=1 Tax=Hebeloma cylindrosporum TaxID=76867 RepID=A0A0C2XDB4_HEBCY|nr:hypothetical protein M413DRAFT_14281 [Hebeloma cylindrosporum h7]
MPPKPHGKILVAEGTHTLKIPPSEPPPNGHPPLQSGPGTPPIPEDPQSDGSNPLQCPSPSSHSPKHTPLDKPNAIGRFMNRIAWWKSSKHSSNQSLADSRLVVKPKEYVSVIILHPPNNYHPLYNLDAKLGEIERDGGRAIHFQCSAASDSHSAFGEIKLEIELFELGNANFEYIVMSAVSQYSIPGHSRTPITPVAFFPKGPLRSNEIPVERKANYGAKGNLGGGGAGVKAGFEVEASGGWQYTNKEGVKFNGQLCTKTKVSWIWIADAVVSGGLEDTCRFWVMIPKVRKGVKAHFKVTCKMRGIRSKLTLPANHKEPAYELELHFEATT